MWEQALLQLADRVELLARNEGLSFERVGDALEPGEPYAEMKGSGYSKYYLEPAEFAERATPAIVWLYEYPTIRRVRLVEQRERGAWEVQSSDGIPFHRDLGPETFRDLVHDLSLRAA